MLILHPNLQHLAKIAARDTGRYSMLGVNVSATADGYRAVATDGKRLAVVEGPNALDGLPATVPALDAAPNGETSATVPAKEFAAALKSAPKSRTRADVQGVACVIGKEVSTLASTDGATVNVSAPRNVEGRFPDWKQVIPDGAPVATVTVDAAYLAELATVANVYADGADPFVSLELRGPNSPIVMRSANGTQTFVGLLMPICKGPTRKFQPVEEVLNRELGRNVDAASHLRHALEMGDETSLAVGIKRALEALSPPDYPLLPVA